MDKRKDVGVVIDQKKKRTRMLDSMDPCTAVSRRQIGQVSKGGYCTKVTREDGYRIVCNVICDGFCQRND